MQIWKENKWEVVRLAGKKPEVWSSFCPVLDQEVCMPNCSLAACGDWLHYKEATTVSCWCLTCKSCRSKHTLWSRQYCVGLHINSTYAWKAVVWGRTRTDENVVMCVQDLHFSVLPVAGRMSKCQPWRFQAHANHIMLPSQSFPTGNTFLWDFVFLNLILNWLDRLILNSHLAVWRRK